MNLRKEFLARMATAIATAVLGLSMLPAHANLAELYIAPQASLSTDSNLLQGCTNETGGTFQAASVNVGNEVDFSISIFGVAPEGGVTFTVRSTNSNIVAAIDPTSGGVPVLFIPEGQNVTTSVFRIVGNQVGRTNLSLAAIPSRFGFSVPLTGWDVGEVSKRFIDANPPINHCRTADNDPSLSTDANILANCGIDDIESVATDGETPILMRLSAGLPGEGCFEVISSAPPEQGRITGEITNTMSANGLEHAFSFYFPPDEFIDSASSRTVELEFTYTPVVSGRRANTTRFSETLKLVRPPVVLMHGLWSDESSWGDDFADNIKGSDGILIKGNYQATNAEEMSTNTAEVGKRIDEALREARKQKIAATKVDYVGHSMGGLLGRLHISGSNYKKPKNLDKGDIRRFVTLNTPYFGSNFPNLVLALHAHNNSALSALIERDIDKVINPFWGVTRSGQSGSIVNGAFCDLAENSAGLTPINTSVPSSHVFSATGGPSSVAPVLSSFLDTILISFEDLLTKTRCIRREPRVKPGNRRCIERAFVYPQTVVDAFRFREANDAIVPASSQLGGLAGASTTTNMDFIHFAAPLVGSAFTKDATTGLNIRSLFDAETASTMLATLGPVLSSGNGVSRTVPGLGAIADATAYASKCSPGGPLDRLVSPLPESASAQVINPSIRIVSPVEGQVFAPGDTVVIDVEITDDDLVSGAEVVGLGLLSDEIEPFQMSVTIPANLVGPITLSPQSYSYDGTNFALEVGQPVNIMIRQSGPPEKLLVDNFIYLPIPDPTGRQDDRVLVRGVYSGVEVALNDPATGTTFVSSNTNVVAVDSKGGLAPVNVGHAVITVENSGLKGFAIVDVAPAGGELLPPEDVTDQLTIARSGLRLNRRTGFFTQRITITNPADIPVPGPLGMVLSGLPSGVVAVNRDNNTDVVIPGSAQFDIPVDRQLNSLLPGAQVTFDIEFVNPNRQRINYTLQVFNAVNL